MANGVSWIAVTLISMGTFLALQTVEANPSLDDKVPDFALKYAPLIWLHSEDPFRPSDVLQHIRHTTPALDFEPLFGLPELGLDNLEILNQFGHEVSLTSADDVTLMPEWIMGEVPDADGKLHRSTACCVILVEKGPRDVDVFYFYFYSYDRGSNITQVLEPIDSLFDLTDEEKKMHFGDHVGDWENNMIRFRDGMPVGIYYSQHTSGKVYDWESKEVEKVDNRPVVYSALGSHANYARTGKHVHDSVLIDYCDAGPRWDPVQSAYFFHLDPDSFKLTRRFLPSETDTDSNFTSFLHYNGRWGDKQYPDSDPRQMTVPYFKIKRFQTGPTGPLSKQLVRKGLSPDHPHIESWMEWAVRIYMSWYPCCLRGWRVWVSGALLLGFLLTVTFGVVCAVRRHKGQGYKKLESDVALQDMLRRGSFDSIETA
ncbi:uncharacterized protein PV09_01439 [Verruconis gallopava]|uniref:Vacuolar protein sorting-associated protein 62 n=1 Tax=Verruconis gallopava TaxID=253628 RepID=A0A0D1XXI9_9PEZI|nr:uncharacterized protein PV09_01439 [Verruconis gallopava]KIW07471.1 hypothetical protein PV09_01439 [Verruconis gallopava]